MENWSGVLALLGPASVILALTVLALLSRKLGRVTQAKPYYLGYIAAALLVSLALLVRAIGLMQGDSLSESDDTILLLVYNVCYALGVTLGLIISWRYWSWLLAERD